MTTPQQAAERPPRCVVQPDTIPQELRDIDRWVLCRWSFRDGKWTKPPFQANRRAAKSTDANTWTSFEAAFAAYEQDEWFDGIGLTVTADDDIIGVDLDHCHDPLNGSTEPWATEIIERLGSYTEVSLSGTGIRIIVRGKLPPGGRKKDGFEVYETGRYLTITGHRLDDTPTEICERQAEIEAVHQQIFGQTKETKKRKADPQPVGLDDADVIAKALLAKNGDKFSKLWNGDTSSYPSDSEADLALCALLSFWTGGDPVAIDRLYRQSGLCRAKWEERHSSDGRSYGELTIDKVLTSATEFYSPRTFSKNGHHAETTPLSAFPNTDLGNAERLVSLHGEDLHYSYELGHWLIWDGQRWNSNRTGEIYRRASLTIRAMYAEAGHLEEKASKLPEGEERAKIASIAEALSAWARKSEGKARAEAMIAWAQSREGIPVLMDQLDADPWLLNVNNGTLDLRTGNSRPHDRGDLITKLAPIIYDPTAEYPLWTDFLDRILPDKEVREFVKRGAGYSITGLSNEEKLFFAYGPTSTGKSTFLQAIKSALGDYSATADFSTFLQRDRENGAPRNDIARLFGKRFVVSIEVEEGQKLAETLIQTLTGGDTVAARFLYRESFEFIPTFTLWLAANNRPKVRADNDANWRRIVQVPFSVQIPEAERDPGVKQALSDPAIAGPAVLRWLVDGYLAFQAHGLKIPESVKAATQDYRDSMNLLNDFVEERCVLLAAARVDNPAFWNAYRTWAQEAGIRHPLGRKKFGNQLETIPGVSRGRDMDARFWTGIGLIQEPE